MQVRLCGIHIRWKQTKVLEITLRLRSSLSLDFASSKKKLEINLENRAQKHEPGVDIRHALVSRRCIASVNGVQETPWYRQ
jgi:hypothetical protein